MELSRPFPTQQTFEGGLGWLATSPASSGKMPVSKRLRYLLLQTRRFSDPIRHSEVDCFARTLACERRHITVADLLAAPPHDAALRRADLVLLGGSGDYSVTDEGIWLDSAFDTLRKIVERQKPLFASCWGFQALARALGGTVAHDPQRAEIGTVLLRLTPEGESDPIFSTLGTQFLAHAGHEDVVTLLPPRALRLASSERAENQAYRLAGFPVYCTQFHPELTREDLLARLRAYPNYVKYAVGQSVEQFAAGLRETPTANALLRKMVQEIFGR